MMSRVIVIFVAVLVFFWLLRRALGSRKKAERPREPAPEAAPAAVSDLVSCAHCGVHLPKGESVSGGDAGGPGGARHFCSDEHRRLGPRSGG